MAFCWCKGHHSIHDITPCVAPAAANVSRTKRQQASNVKPPAVEKHPETHQLGGCRHSQSGYNANLGSVGGTSCVALMMIITFTSWTFTYRHFITRRHEVPFAVTRQLRAIVDTSRASLRLEVCPTLLLTPAEFRKCVT